MFILDIKKNNPRYRFRKTILVYILFSVFAIAINKIYALFGHGVSSNAMTWMFLYPLLGGVLFYLLIRIAFAKINHFKGFGMFFNLYNSGIATLTVGSLLRGILEIAGTSSSYEIYFHIVGWAFIACGFFIFLILVINYNKIDAVEFN